MIGKILSLPFVLVGKALGLVLWIVKLILSIVFGSIRFVFTHILGTVFGALIGLLLGQKHIGIKLFPRKKKAKPVEKA